MKINKVEEIGNGLYKLTLIPSLYFAWEGIKDKNHFPIDEKTGKHLILFKDKECTEVIIIFGESDIIKTIEGKGLALIINVKDTTEVKKAANTFSAIFSNSFTEKVKIINEITVNNEKCYTAIPAKIPYIPMYLENVGNWLEYLKNVFGFGFKQYVYNEFCKGILNYRVNYESGLYSDGIPETHINAVKIWIENQDKIIQREAEFHKLNKTSSSQHKTSQKETSPPQPSKIKAGHEFNNLLKAIGSVCVDIIEYPKDNYELFKSKNIDREDREDKRTRRIENKLKSRIEHFVDFQHKTGVSGIGKKKRDGTPDLAFIKKDKTKLTIGEALNFSGINTKKLNQEIISHLNKLVDNYNKSRLPNLLFLVYYEGNSANFYDSFTNYLKNFKACEKLIYTCLSIEDVTPDYIENSATIKIGKSNHSYSNDLENRFSIYHFYIDFSEK